MRLNWRGDKPVIQTVHGDVFLVGPYLAGEQVVEFFRKFEETASVDLKNGTIEIVDEEALHAVRELEELQRECEAKAEDFEIAAGVAKDHLRNARDAVKQALKVLWTDPLEAQRRLDHLLGELGAVEQALDDVDT